MIVDEVRHVLNTAETLIVFAGAGASVDFGLTTYWTGPNNAYGGDDDVFGHTQLEHATYPCWEENYDAHYAHHERRRRGVDQAATDHPDNVYSRLKQFSDRRGINTFLVTTNVDGYGRRFGITSDHVLEVHGALDYNQCWVEPAHQVHTSLTCVDCGGKTRPNTMMFQDFVFNPARLHTQTNHYNTFLDLHDSDRIVILEVGVGDTVPRLKNMQKRLAWETGTARVRVNPEESELESGAGGERWAARTSDLYALMAS